MELFVIIVNGWKPLTTITKSSISDVSGVLDPPLILGPNQSNTDVSSVTKNCNASLKLQKLLLLKTPSVYT